MIGQKSNAQYGNFLIQGSHLLVEVFSAKETNCVYVLNLFCCFIFNRLMLLSPSL